MCLNLVKSKAHHYGSPSPKPNLLDIGCGIGGWMKVASNSFNVWGFDASMAQVLYAQKEFPQVQYSFSYSDYVSTLADPPAFDLITLWDVLEHIRNPVEFVGEIVENMPINGLFFCAVPAAFPMVAKSNLRNYGWPSSRFRWNAHEHVVYYSPTTLKKLCAKTGLDVISVGSVPVYPRPFSFFEAIRRSAFIVFSKFPSIAPQLYLLARKK